MKNLVVLFPLIKMIAEFLVKMMDISEDKKIRFFAAIQAVEDERNVPLRIQAEIKKQRASVSSPNPANASDRPKEF